MMMFDKEYLKDRLAKSKRVESAFAAAAVGILPIEEARYLITSAANIYYMWPSTSEGVGRLVVLFDEVEIVLSTEYFHTHIGRSDYRMRDGCLFEGEFSCEEDEFVKFITQTAVAEASEIMGGNKVFAFGEQGQSRMMSPRDVWESENSENSGFEKYTRFWTWHGEIFRS